MDIENAQKFFGGHGVGHSAAKLIGLQKVMHTTRALQMIMHTTRASINITP